MTKTKLLRDLADKIDQEKAEIVMTIYEHGVDVTDHDLGNMIVDNQWIGRTIVIQTEKVNLKMLLARLLEELKPQLGEKYE